MTHNTFNAERLQHDLAQAFKWMGKATKESQEGDFTGATYSMMTAMEYWVKCQHIRDKYIEDDFANQIDWKFFEKRAMVMARQQLEEEAK